VGSPAKKNVISGGSPISSPLKHPRADFTSAYAPSH